MTTLARTLVIRSWLRRSSGSWGIPRRSGRRATRQPGGARRERLPPENSTSFCIAGCFRDRVTLSRFWVWSILEAWWDREHWWAIVQIDTIVYSAGEYGCRAAFAKVIGIPTSLRLVPHVPCIGPHGTGNTGGFAHRDRNRYYSKAGRADTMTWFATRDLPDAREGLPCPGGLAELTLTHHLPRVMLREGLAGHSEISCKQQPVPVPWF